MLQLFFELHWWQKAKNRRLSYPNRSNEWVHCRSGWEFKFVTRIFSSSFGKVSFSDFCLIFPLKTKTSTEVSKILLYSVCQHFNVKKIHTDNGSAFRSKDFLSELSALGIKMVNTSALHPAGRGSIERFVQTVKVLLKKIVATRPTYDWQLIPFIISKTINNTKSTKTGFEPATMVFGKSQESTFLELEKFAPPKFPCAQ